jgi:hypothetical protein
MTTERRYSTARIRLKTPKDGRRLIRRALAEIFDKKQEVESAGKIANLLTVWAKLWELDEVRDIEKRLEALEEKLAAEEA